MQAIQITSSISTAGGGISSVVVELAGALRRAGCEVPVLGMEDQGAALENVDGIKPRCFPLSGRFPIPWSSALRQALATVDTRIFHLHGLWTYPSVIIPEIARQRGVPWVVSPHGMLDPWALRNSRWKKRIAAKLFENRNLNGATCLHALCESEADSMRRYGLTHRIAIIPNGVDLPASRPIRSIPTGCRKQMLFLGRLHPKKGLVPLLSAWPKQRKEDWQLVIAGWTQGGHKDFLKALCREKSLSFSECPAEALVDGGLPGTATADVVFTGPAFGNVKEKLFAACDAFVLPSFSEGLPIAVLEAWAHGLPVMMTSNCNLPQGFATGSAFECSTSSQHLHENLREFLSIPPAELQAMGKRGRELVEDRFTWPVVARQMLQLYSGLLGK